jgi:RNA polymerase sigma factor (sigma-70 family)
MATSPNTTLLRHIRKLASTQDADVQLLQRYIATCDEAAFTALVERHGPMVRSVCRAVLHHEQDAEDAFQATFLVLARRAPTIRKRQSVGSWLHGVAYRLALKMQRRAARQRRRDQRAPPTATAGTMDDLTWRELRGVLHEEVHRLVEKYRAPLVLCYWEGKTRDEAAALLGWTLGTLKERLERGRALLRSRLTRRGLVPSAALFATLLAEHAADAALPGALVETTTQAALGFAARQAGASGTAASLAQSVLRGTRLARWSLMLLIAVGIGGLSALTYMALLGDSSEQHAETQTVPAEAVPAPAAPPQPMPVRQDRPRPQFPTDPLPDGAVAQFGSVRLQDASIDRCASFSPDSKLLATAGSNSPVCIWDVATGKRFATYRISASVTDLAFQRDGKLAVLQVFGGEAFAMRQFTPGEPPDPRADERLIEEARARERKGQAPTPTQGRLYHSFLSADGQWVVAIRNSADKPVQWAEIYRFTPGHSSNTVKPTHRVSLPAGYGTWLARDKQWLLAHVEPEKFDQQNRLVALALAPDQADKPAWDLSLGTKTERRPASCFSLDGKQVVIRFFDGSVELWDGPAGKRVRTFPKVPIRYVHSNGEWGGIDLSADGKRLALLHRSADGAIRGQVVEVATARKTADLHPEPLPRNGGPGGTYFSPDGRRVARMGFGAVRIWDADTGADACPLPGHRGGVASLGIGTKFVVSTGDDLTVRRWDPTTGEERWQTVLPVVTSVKFMTEGYAIVSEDQRWGYDELAVRIDLATGERKPLPGKLGTLKSQVPLAIAPDRKRVVALNRDRKDPAFDVWSWPAGQPLAHVPIVPPDKLAVNRCAAAYFTPDGKQLVAVMYYDDPKANLRISRLPARPYIERWDLSAGELLDRTKPSSETPHLLTYAKGLLLWDSGTELRDPVSGRVIVKLLIPENERFAPPWWQVAAVSHDGAQFAVGETSSRVDGHRVLVFDAGTGGLIRKLTVPSAQPAYLHGMQFLADGRLVTLGETAIVWSRTAGSP